MLKQLPIRTDHVISSKLQISLRIACGALGVSKFVQRYLLFLLTSRSKAITQCQRRFTRAESVTNFPVAGSTELSSCFAPAAFSFATSVVMLMFGLKTPSALLLPSRSFPAWPRLMRRSGFPSPRYRSSVACTLGYLASKRSNTCLTAG